MSMNTGTLPRGMAISANSTQSMAIPVPALPGIQQTREPATPRLSAGLLVSWFAGLPPSYPHHHEYRRQDDHAGHDRQGVVRQLTRLQELHLEPGEQPQAGRAVHPRIVHPLAVEPGD